MGMIENFSQIGVQQYQNFGFKKPGEASKSPKEAKAKEVEAKGSAQKTKLSEKAQKLLEKLKKQYGNMDFMVGDFDSDTDKMAALSRGTKEFSVLFSSEELEKMAEDEDYQAKQLEQLESATEISKKLGDKLAEKAAENGEEDIVSRIGISFNADGSMSYFAELQKVSDKQGERIENMREKKAEEKKAAEKKADGGKAGRYKDFDGPAVKEAKIKANSEEELLKLIEELDWSKIPDKMPKNAGTRMDFSI